jgi:nucleotide-binding universal stress UspA family protein
LVIKILNILVGIDGSEYSFNAARYAIDISKRYGSEILFLSVVPSKIHYGNSSGIFGAISPSYFKEYKKEAERWFQVIIDMAKDEDNFEMDKKIKTDIITTPLSAAAAILNYAEEHYVDLIVIGNKGNSGIKKMLLGSVASDVVTYSYCPVMIIK